MEIIKALVEAGADIQMPNHFGGTCLINRWQHLGSLWLLAKFLNVSRQRPVSISRGIPHQVRKEHYTSQIEKSKWKTKVKNPDWNLRHGADVNAEDVQHKTALHYAVQEHRLDTTKVNRARRERGWRGTMMLRGKALGDGMLVFCHGYVSNHCLWVLRARGVLHSSMWLKWVCVRIVFVFAQEIQIITL